MPTVEELRDMEETSPNGHGTLSIEDMAEDPEGMEEEDTAVYIEGTTGQLSLAVGGRKPDSSEFKMKSVGVRVREGQYVKGETVMLKVIARIDEIKFVDTHDEYGTITSTKRVHTAKPIAVERIVEDTEE